MPTYDYECDACGHSFDAFQSMSEDPLRKCPSCGKLKLRRLIGGGLGVIFKGSGFYSTDTRGGAATSEKKAGTEAPSTEGKTDSPAGTDAKTDTKADKKSTAQSGKTSTKKEGVPSSG